ncbi:MAG: hypothetical protein OEY89_11045 [Gammaproteobacteria bacterium]|nr:hypothetical protein [Gammaproteobacteria bacterium]
MNNNKADCPIIMDLEASGFGKGSYPVEIGVALEDGATHCYLLKPKPEWTHWDEEGERLHGITREVLLQHGKELDVVARELNAMLSGCTVYSDGWGNDISWLYLMYDAVDMVPSYRLETLPAIISRKQMSLWDRTKQQVFSYKDFKRHRASNDARALQLTYQMTRDKP